MSKGGKLHFLISSDETIHISHTPLKIRRDVLAIHTEESQAPGLILAAGTLKMNAKHSTLTFEPSFVSDQANDNASIISRSLKDLDPNLKFRYPKKRSDLLHLNCHNLLTPQEPGSGFVINKLLADNLVMSTAILVGEINHSGRLESDRGKQVVISDFVGGNINSVINSGIAKYLILSGKGLGINLVGRAVTGLSMIEVQKKIYQQILDEEPRERSEKIAQFDTAYLFGRMPLSYLVDRFLLKELPPLLQKMCAAGRNPSVFISPTSIRIMEKYGFAILYYGLRKQMVDE